jgi:hypothetical protein
VQNIERTGFILHTEGSPPRVFDTRSVSFSTMVVSHSYVFSVPDPHENKHFLISYQCLLDEQSRECYMKVHHKRCTVSVPLSGQNSHNCKNLNGIRCRMPLRFTDFKSTPMVRVLLAEQKPPDCIGGFLCQNPIVPYLYPRGEFPGDGKRHSCRLSAVTDQFRNHSKIHSRRSKPRSEAVSRTRGGFLSTVILPVRNSGGATQLEQSSGLSSPHIWPNLWSLYPRISNVNCLWRTVRETQQVVNQHPERPYRGQSAISHPAIRLQMPLPAQTSAGTWR